MRRCRWSSLGGGRLVMASAVAAGWRQLKARRLLSSPLNGDSLVKAAFRGLPGPTAWYLSGRCQQCGQEGEGQSVWGRSVPDNSGNVSFVGWARPFPRTGRGPGRARVTLTCPPSWCRRSATSTVHVRRGRAEWAASPCRCSGRRTVGRLGLLPNSGKWGSTGHSIRVLSRTTRQANTGQSKHNSMPRSDHLIQWTALCTSSGTPTVIHRGRSFRCRVPLPGTASSDRRDPAPGRVAAALRACGQRRARAAGRPG